MPKRVLYCESCDKEYTISFKGDDEPCVCPWCGEDIDTDWNSSEEKEDD